MQEKGVCEELFNKVMETQTGEMEVNIKEKGNWMNAHKYSYEMITILEI